MIEESAGCLTGYYVIKIEWKVGETALINAFRKWMKRHKPLGMTEPPDERIHYVDWFRQLGALRLLRVMSVEDANTHTTSVLKRPCTQDHGVGLYAHDCDYSTAKSEADRRLVAFFGVDD